MFSNAKLRLLMTLVELERLGVEDVPGASWIVPSSLDSNYLRTMKAVIDRCLDSPMVGDLANDPREMLRRKYPNETSDSSKQTALNAIFGSESEGEDIPDTPLFPPNPRTKAQALDGQKKRKKGTKNDDKEPTDETTLEVRRQARLDNTRARLAKIKSDLYVHASDEDTDEGADEQFFMLEEKRRKEQAERVRKALLTGIVSDVSSDTRKGSGRRKRQTERDTSQIPGKRQRRVNDTSVSDADDDDVLMDDMTAESPRSQRDVLHSPSLDDDLQFDDDLAFSRNRNLVQGSPHGQSLEPDSLEADGETTRRNDVEDGPTQPPARRRIRAGFVIDSDSE